MKNLVVLSGAGISAESGLATFRDQDGLWENHRIEDVAHIDAWHRDPARVLRFYDQRRLAARQAQPNPAHLACAQLQQHYHTHIITQNVDDLHERAGSKQVLHLHGQLELCRSTIHPAYVVPVKGESLQLGQLCPMGGQLRPHIVWFGEEVPLMQEAIAITHQADIFVVVGTSLQVYPAAGLLHAVPPHATIYCVDPAAHTLGLPAQVQAIAQPASVGMQQVLSELLG